MSFGRSNSLSINTGGSLFNASQPPKSGSLFGSTSTSSNQPGGGLFGSNTSQPQQGGGLFGSGQTSQPQQSSGMFGSSNTSSSQPAQGGGLFGTSTNTQTGGGLFGMNSNQQNQGQGGSPFSHLNKSQPAPTPSLFGTTTTQQQQQPSLFSTTTTSQPQTSLFGTTTTTSQPQQGTLFGSTLGAGGLGQSTAQQPQNTATVSGVVYDTSNIRGTTRFSDLQPNLQKEIELTDNLIQAQISFHDQIAAMLPRHRDDTDCMPQDVQFVSGKVDAVEVALDNDASTIRKIKELVQSDAEDARVAFRTIDNLKLPSHFHQVGLSYGGGGRSAAAIADLDGDSSPPDLIVYFTRQVEELQKKLGTYQGQIGEVEQHLRTVEASAMQPRRRFEGESDLRELAESMQGFENAILRVAAKIGEAREALMEVTLQNGLR